MDVNACPDRALSDSVFSQRVVRVTVWAVDSCLSRTVFSESGQPDTGPSAQWGEHSVASRLSPLGLGAPGWRVGASLSHPSALLDSALTYTLEGREEIFRPNAHITVRFSSTGEW